MERRANVRRSLAGAASAVALAAILAFVASPTASAHSLDDVEQSLHERDRYAQFIDRQAPAFTLTTASGEDVSLADWSGKVVVMNFIYARCTDVCPVHSALIADLQQRIADAGLADQVQFLSLATDPENASQTRQIIADYGDMYGLHTDNWRMLYRGDRAADAVLRLAQVYGLKFTVTPEGPQVHGVVTHVIDTAGRLRARFHGSKFDPWTLVDYVEALAAEAQHR